uniref:Immunoglobulin V-set domain-containing protein n=1 Tax=Amphilophus citrinellus TaxID=61819 RepID=A0A3Q0SGT4_AMPCI
MFSHYEIWLTFGFIALRCVTSAVGVIHVTGYVGRKVNVSCSYDRGYESYEKYLCKDGCGSSDALITSDNKQNGRFRLDDENVLRNFTVTIISLSQNDSGSYLCGVQTCYIRDGDVVPLVLSHSMWFTLCLLCYVPE